MADATTEAFRHRLERSAEELPLTTKAAAEVVLGIEPDTLMPDVGEEIKRLLLRQSSSFDTHDLRAAARTFALERAIHVHKDPSDKILDRIAHYFGGGLLLAPPKDDAWDRAIAIARAEIVLERGYDIPDARENNATAAGERLYKLGYELETRDGALHFKPGELERACEQMRDDLQALGAIDFLLNMFSLLERTVGYKYDQYLIAQNYGLGGSTEPALPVGFLLNLAVRVVPFAARPAQNPELIWKSLLRLATDVATLLDVQTTSQFDLINVSPARIAGKLGALAQGDHVYGLRQWPLEFTKIVIEAVFAPVAVAMNQKLGWDYKAVLALCDQLARSAKADPAAIDTATLWRGCPAGFADAFTHRAPAPNEHYETPRDARQADLMFKPLVAIDDTRVWVQARPLAGPAFYEATMSAYRAAFSRSAADNLVGPGTETVTKEVFRRAGLAPSIIGAEYKTPVNAAAGECDFVVESADGILLVECKAKPLTRAAMSGDAMAALLDFLGNVVKAQSQALRHERLLRTQGWLVFDDGRRLDWNARPIVRLSVSLLELGALGDRMTLWNLLNPLAQIKLSYAPTDPRAQSYKELNDALDELQNELNTFATLGVARTAPMVMSSLSVGQLHVFLRDKPTLATLLSRVAPAGGFMSFNPVFELDQLMRLQGET